MYNRRANYKRLRSQIMKKQFGNREADGEARPR